MINELPDLRTVELPIGISLGVFLDFYENEDMTVSDLLDEFLE